MAMFRSDERTEIEELYTELPPSAIPTPHFLSTAFPETPLTYCCPLPAPFDAYAITHIGVVFQYRPLELVLGPAGWTIHPQVCLQIEDDPDERAYVTLHYGLGHLTQLYVDRLVLNRFFGVSLTQPIYIFYHDNDRMNTSYHNLTAIYPESLQLARRYQAEGLDDIEYQIQQSIFSETAFVRGADYQGNPHVRSSSPDLFSAFPGSR